MKQILSKMLFEITAVVIGISIAFFVDEAKDRNQHKQARLMMMKAIQSEIVSDSVNVNGYLQKIDLYLKSYRKLLTDSMEKDSMINYIDRLITYIGYKPTNLYYTEMQQAGTSNLFTGRILLNQVIELNEKEARLIDETVSIDKHFILNRMIPYLEREGKFPYIFGIDKALIKDNEFRNLVFTNILFKEIDRSVITRYKLKSVTLVNELEMEIRKLD